MGTFDPKGAVVLSVDPEGPAAAAGLLPGDEILEVAGKAPLDLMDFLDRAAWGPTTLKVRREGRDFESVLDKTEEEPLGLEFTDTLFSRVKTCRNKCVFCFMDQMPKKMRPSLYYRDDDYRLSSLHGNFITLTNLSDEEWERIRVQRVSPLYVSVHATEEKLREELLGSTKQANMDVMVRLRQLQEWGIDFHTQVVLMPGINDGEALERTIADLATLLPALQTISIVPVGLTRYRAHLPHLRPVTAEMVPALIKQITPHQERFEEEWGEKVVFLADEMFLIAGLPQPPHSFYGDYPQLENGVGMVRHFLMDFQWRKGQLGRRPLPGGNWLMITGEYGGQIFPPLVAELEKRCPGLRIKLKPVVNRFFGEMVKCAGLLAGRDMLAALEEEADFLSKPGATVMVPGVALKDAAVTGNSQAGLLLDDISLQGLADRFGVPFVNGGSSCPEWLESLRDGQGLLRVEPTGERSTPVVVHQFPEHAAR